jgi:hypothetical protein
VAQRGVSTEKAEQPPGTPLRYKPDWPEAQKRWIAFWQRDKVDRPLMDVKARLDNGHGPAPHAKSVQDRYFDPGYVTRSWVRTLESTYYGAEAVPVGGFLMGAYALGCGPQVVFDEHTVWHPHTWRSLDDPVPWQPGAEDPWRHKLERVIRRLQDVGPDKFLIGYVMQVPVNDLLYLLRGGADFLADLARDADKCVERLEQMWPLWVHEFENFRNLIDRRQKGCAWGWPGL